MKQGFTVVIATFVFGLVALTGIVVYNLFTVINNVEAEKSGSAAFYRISVTASRTLLDISTKTNSLFDSKTEQKISTTTGEIDQLFTEFKSAIATLKSDKFTEILDQTIEIEATKTRPESKSATRLGELLRQIETSSLEAEQAYKDVSVLASRQLEIRQQLEPLKKDLSKLLRDTLNLQPLDPKAYNDLSRGAITVLYTNSGRDIKFAGSSKFESGYLKLLKQDLSNTQRTSLDNLKASFDQTYELARIQLSTGSDSEFFIHKAQDAVAGIKLLEDKVNDIFQAGQESLVERAQRTMFSAIVIAVLIICICIASGLFISLRLINRVNTIVERMQDISEGDGDLTARLSVSGEDELAELGGAFNTFIDKLQTSIEELANSVARLTTFSAQMFDANHRSAEGMKVQKQETELVARAISEMSKSAAEVATSAERASDSATDSENHALHGLTVVKETMSSMNLLAEQIESASRVVNELEKDSQSIGAVIDVIKGVAEQTNLLALNAAIEAARAGEQGRGFAVVADEVRTLASRTQESTEEIVAMVNHIQEGAIQAVSVMDKSQSQVTESVSKVEGAGGSLDAIAQAIGNIRSMNLQIAASAEQQSNTVSEVNTNITAISNASESTVALSASALKIGLELNGQIETVGTVLSHFKYR